MLKFFDLSFGCLSPFPPSLSAQFDSSSLILKSLDLLLSCVMFRLPSITTAVKEPSQLAWR
jgi:hypothetical protein